MLDYMLQTIFHLNAIQNKIFIFAIADHVVHANDILFVVIFRVAYNGGACLEPGIAAIFVHKTVVMGEYLAFVYYCGWQQQKQIKVRSMAVRWISN